MTVVITATLTHNAKYTNNVSTAYGNFGFTISTSKTCTRLLLKKYHKATGCFTFSEGTFRKSTVVMGVNNRFPKASSALRRLGKKVRERQGISVDTELLWRSQTWYGLRVMGCVQLAYQTIKPLPHNLFVQNHEHQVTRCGPPHISHYTSRHPYKHSHFSAESSSKIYTDVWSPPAKNPVSARVASSKTAHAQLVGKIRAPSTLSKYLSHAWASVVPNGKYVPRIDYRGAAWYQNDLARILARSQRSTFQVSLARVFPSCFRSPYLHCPGYIRPQHFPQCVFFISPYHMPAPVQSSLRTLWCFLEACMVKTKTCCPQSGTLF